jgi:hypothetical protein
VSVLLGPQRRRTLRSILGPVRLTALGCGIVGGLCSAGLTIALTVRAPDRDLAIRLYAASIAALVSIVLVRLLGVASRRSSEPGFVELLRPPERDADLSQTSLASIEQSLRFAASAAGDFHARLRPLLVELAENRLGDRGLRLSYPLHQERIEAILGPVAYDLVRYDRPAPGERFDPGVPIAHIEATIAAIEALS